MLSLQEILQKLSNMKIPLVDLKAQYYSIKEEIDRAIASVINKSQFIGGDELKNFEQNFASYCERKFGIGSSSGSTALLAVLKCLGIKQDDEVIIPVNTFIATAFAVTLCGAKPVFIDVNESDFLINSDLIEGKITEKTKAIIPVHLYGNVCDMDKIIEIAKKHNLHIIEDCAQAHGSTYKGKKVPVKDIGCFSFFPIKNLGAYGDAGCIVSNNEEFAKKLRRFVNHGRLEKYLHVEEGFNFRLDNLQAAILNVKLKYLDSWIEKKREIAKIYDSELKNFKKQVIKEDVGHSYHLYVIRCNDRDKLKKYLDESSIETGIHYPIPLHLQPAFHYLGYKNGDFPVAEKLSKNVLSIPIYAELKEGEQRKVIDIIKSYFLK